MTYTTQQLQAMSDFEVNKALAEKLPYTHVIGDGKYPSQSDDAVHVERRKTKYGNIEEIGIDYCNNPNDIMPLAFERGISIMRTTDKWHACSNRYIGEGLHFFDDLPLRAIACLLLMMED